MTHKTYINARKAKHLHNMPFIRVEVKNPENGMFEGIYRTRIDIGGVSYAVGGIIFKEHSSIFSGDDFEYEFSGNQPTDEFCNEILMALECGEIRHAFRADKFNESIDREQFTRMMRWRIDGYIQEGNLGRARACIELTKSLMVNQYNFKNDECDVIQHLHQYAYNVNDAVLSISTPLSMYWDYDFEAYYNEQVKYHELTIQ